MTVKNTVMPAIAILALSGFAHGTDASQTSGACLGIASEFNVFVQHDFTAQSTDTQGSIAVGGDFTVSNYGVASSILLRPDEYSLLVGGNFSISNGQVYTGSVVTGGDESGIDYGSFQLADTAASLYSNTTPDIDFVAEFAKLAEFSQSLTELESTGNIHYESWGGIYLRGDCYSDIQVFNLDGETLQNAVVFSLECVPADATVIFNIDGTDVGMHDMGLGQFAAQASQIIYNFYEATSVEFANIGIEGSILAPKADAQTSWGYVNGSVFTKSWSGPMELHDALFSGCSALPENIAPEPS